MSSEVLLGWVVGLLTAGAVPLFENWLLRRKERKKEHDERLRAYGLLASSLRRTHTNLDTEMIPKVKNLLSTTPTTLRFLKQLFEKDMPYFRIHLNQVDFQRTIFITDKLHRSLELAESASPPASRDIVNGAFAAAEFMECVAFSKQFEVEILKTFPEVGDGK